MEQEKYHCDDCFHYEVCGRDLTPKSCDHFVEWDCVEILMNDDQLQQATKELNAHMERLLNLKRRLDGGEQSMDLYRDIINLDY